MQTKRAIHRPVMLQAFSTCKLNVEVNMLIVGLRIRKEKKRSRNILCKILIESRNFSGGEGVILSSISAI